MFRKLQKYLSDESAGYQDFNQSQRVLYQEQLPNIVPVRNQEVKNSLQNVISALATTNPITRRTETDGVDIYTYASPTELSDDINSKIRGCETASIEGLIANQNPFDKTRCGWLYEKGPSGAAPKLSQGVLGTVQGPLRISGVQNKNPSNYYWNLLDAQKAMSRDRCNDLLSCTNVENSDYAGKCAYDPIKGRGVPIFPNGQVMFANDPTLSANPANLITKRDKCPPPPSVGSPAYDLQQSRDVCAPLPNGTLSRDCLLQQVSSAGCNDQGALVQALRSGNNMGDYASNLRKMTPFIVYQQRSAIPLSGAMLKDGSVSKDVALSNFRGLAQQMGASNAGLRSASRDLCVQAGALDSYDFCSELTETSSAPYTVSCLQKEWKKRGGLETGAKYPSTNTIESYWNKFYTGGLVLKNMDRLAIESSDKNQGFIDINAENKQRKALTDFYGIDRQPPPPPQIPAVLGLEVFWIDLTNDTFLGRVNSENPPEIDTGGIINGVNKADRVQFVMMTNIRPQGDGLWRIGVVTDDGVSITLNRNYEPKPPHDKHHSADTNIVRNDTNDFRRWYLQGPSKHVNDSCWMLKKGGPNIVVADWYENYGWARFKLFLTPCDDKNKEMIIPTDRYTLTQEQDAPMLSWEYKDGRFEERRLPGLFTAAMYGSAYIDNERKAVRLVRNGGIRFNRPISVNSWRTITVHFTMYAKPVDRQIFCTYGDMFEIYFQGGKTYVKYMGPSVPKTLEWDTNYNPGESYMFHINMRNSFEGSVPDIFTVGVHATSWWANGNFKKGFEYKSPNNQPLYNSSDTHVFSMGGGSVSADIGVQRVRFFDYELDTNDVARDAKNNWQMQWTS